MDRKNMVILIPFKLMKLRSWIDKDRKRMTKSPEELKELKSQGRSLIHGLDGIISKFRIVSKNLI